MYVAIIFIEFDEDFSLGERATWRTGGSRAEGGSVLLDHVFTSKHRGSL